MSVKIRAIAKRLVLDYVLGKFATFTAVADAIGVTQVFQKILNKRPSDTAGAADQIGPFAVGKNLSETPSVLDSPAKTFTTSRADASSVSDNDSLTIGKVFDESLRATDDFDGTATPEDDQEINFGKIIVQPTFVAENFERVVSYNRAFSDSGSANEQLANTLTKVLTDQVNAAESIFLTRAKQNEDTSGVTENAVFEFGKNRSDASLIAEFSVFSIGKSLSEAPIATESIAFSGGKSLTDSSIVVDTDTLAIGKTLSDSSTLADDPAFDISKALTEQPGVAELAALGSSKTFADGGITTDSPVKSIGKDFADSSTFEDDGSLRSQGYCDFDYFSEDYVGQSRTFT
jgi:hypothetical protein